MKTLVMSLLILVGFSAHSEGLDSKVLTVGSESVRVDVQRDSRGIAEGVRFNTSDGMQLSQLNVSCSNPNHPVQKGIDIVSPSKADGRSCVATYLNDVSGTSEPQVIGESSLSPVQYCIGNAQNLIDNLSSKGFECGLDTTDPIEGSIY